MYPRIIVAHYGGPDVLRPVEEERPEPKEGEVRVRAPAWGEDVGMNSRNIFRFVGLSLGPLCALLAVGCIIVPIRTKTVIQNPNAQKALLPKLALVPGQTKRTDVEQEYKDFAVESEAAKLFWGRFRKSSWAIVGGAGGPGGAVAGGGRTWGTYNLLVTFDSDGTVRDSQIVHDKELIDRFITICKEGIFPALDLSQPVYTGGMFEGVIPVDLQLSRSSAVITREKPPRRVHKKMEPQPPEVITVPMAEITGIRVGYNQEPYELPITIQFAQKTKFGKHITLMGRPVPCSHWCAGSNSVRIKTDVHFSD